MRFLIITAVCILLVIHAETKDLICIKTGETASTLGTYRIVRGKKGASGMKGFKGEPAHITEQDLEKLESKTRICIIASVVLVCYNIPTKDPAQLYIGAS